MVSVCRVPARGGRLCERFGGNKTINRIPLPALEICVCPIFVKKQVPVSSHDSYHTH